jgi:hypothetical protein
MSTAVTGSNRGLLVKVKPRAYTQAAQNRLTQPAG